MGCFSYYCGVCGYHEQFDYCTDAIVEIRRNRGHRLASSSSSEEPDVDLEDCPSDVSPLRQFLVSMRNPLHVLDQGEPRVAFLGSYDSYGRVRVFGVGNVIPSQFDEFIDGWGEAWNYRKYSTTVFCKPCYAGLPYRRRNDLRRYYLASHPIRGHDSIDDRSLDGKAFEAWRVGENEKTRQGEEDMLARQVLPLVELCKIRLLELDLMSTSRVPGVNAEAEQRYAALYGQAYCYENGVGVERDEGKAAELLSKSARESGHAIPPPLPPGRAMPHADSSVASLFGNRADVGDVGIMESPATQRRVWDNRGLPAHLLDFLGNTKGKSFWATMEVVVWLLKRKASTFFRKWVPLPQRRYFRMVKGASDWYTGDAAAPDRLSADALHEAAAPPTAAGPLEGSCITPTGFVFRPITSGPTASRPVTSPLSSTSTLASGRSAFRLGTTAVQPTASSGASPVDSPLSSSQKATANHTNDDSVSPLRTLQLVTPVCDVAGTAPACLTADEIDQRDIGEAALWREYAAIRRLCPRMEDERGSGSLEEELLERSKNVEMQLMEVRALICSPHCLDTFTSSEKYFTSLQFEPLKWILHPPAPLRPIYRRPPPTAGLHGHGMWIISDEEAFDMCGLFD